MEPFVAQLTEFGDRAMAFLGQPEILLQLGLVVVLLAPSWLLARRLKPVLESRARELRGFPGLLRMINALERRIEWLFFFLLLGVAYLVTGALGWPENNAPIYGAMLLSGAWFAIYLGSHALRSRTLGRMFALIAWAWVSAMILGLDDDLIAMLDGAGFFIGETRISVLRVGQAVLFLCLLLWLSLSLGNFLDRRLQAVDELTPSLRVLLGKILRISLLVLAILIAVQSLGIDLTALTVLSGAVGVGIGFGLQKVVSNFISGIIILLDRSIKPGDTITLGETFGWIRELRARFVSVVTRDGREYLIPNEDFITREVINWSFSDNFVRLDVPFGVSYDSDPHEVTRLAIKAAAGVDRVAEEYSPPACWLTDFGESSLDFVLRFWIDDPQKGLTNVRGKVLLALWDSFQEHGIAIPYPHREVIMKTPIELSGSGLDRKGP